MIRRPVALAGLGALVLLAGAFLLGSWLRPFPPVPPSHAEMRLGLVNVYLGQVAAPYVFLAGDSFVELYQPEPLPCGREVVNGGVGGFRVGEYLAFERGLAFRSPPAAVFLGIGLNDLWRKHRPGDETRFARFRQDAEALIGELGRGGAKVVVAEIPPIDATVADAFDTASFRRYGDAYREICGRLGCEVADPYRAYRTEDYWRAKPGASPDWIHLGDLRGAFRTLQPALCR